MDGSRGDEDGFGDNADGSGDGAEGEWADPADRADGIDGLDTEAGGSGEVDGPESGGAIDACPDDALAESCAWACPALQPAALSACSPVSLACMYGDISCTCTSNGWTCTGGMCITGWPMPNARAPADEDGGDADAGPLLPNPPSYDLGTPGVVVDRITGLMWQRDVDANTYDWAGATAYCEGLSLAGYDDWRLPSRIELVSLIDSSRANPAIDPLAFPDTPSEFFWTSRAIAAPPGADPAAWSINFATGSTYSSVTQIAFRVRCMREP